MDELTRLRTENAKLKADREVLRIWRDLTAPKPCGKMTGTGEPRLLYMCSDTRGHEDPCTWSWFKESEGT